MGDTAGLRLRRRAFASLVALIALPGLSPFDVVPAAHSTEALPTAAEADAAVALDPAAVLEAKALAMAADTGLVTVDDAGTPCASDLLTVSWTAPGDGYSVGGYIDPVGPRPEADTTSVNGVVLCLDSAYSYLGFEAVREGDEWTVSIVPSVSLDEHDGEDGENLPEPPPPVVEPDAPVAALPSPALPDGIESYAGYDPQSTCDPLPKPGVVAFRDLLLRKYPWTHSAGISRGCGVGGRSEHKEGRALDWSVNVNAARDKAAAEEVIAWLLATDSAGNAHALVRRTGLMYVIWNRQIWAAYRPGAGWRPYSGPSAHTDHVHFSFSWAGAKAQTSFFSGAVAEVAGVGLGTTASTGGGNARPSVRKAVSSRPVDQQQQREERRPRRRQTVVTTPPTPPPTFERERRRRYPTTTTTAPTQPPTPSTTQPRPTERRRTTTTTTQPRDDTSTTPTTVTSASRRTTSTTVTQPRRRGDGRRSGRRPR